MDPASVVLRRQENGPLIQSGTEIGQGPGAAGSEWDTCVWVHNPGGAAADVQFQLLLRNQPNPNAQVLNDTLPPGDTRHDAFAEANRIAVEEDKPDAERGRYLHAEAFGLPAELAIGRGGH